MVAKVVVGSYDMQQMSDWHKYLDHQNWGFWRAGNYLQNVAELAINESSKNKKYGAWLKQAYMAATRTVSGINFY